MGETPEPLVLVAENSDSIRAELLRQLGDRGHRVAGAGDGEQALALVERELPDVVLLDHELPGLDGMTVLDRLRADLGVGESGLQRVVRGAYELLDLLAFFTAGEDKPAQSWHLRRGQTAWHAAGEIHSDIQRGFVRAEVIGWDALTEAGGYAGARDRGTLRLEGRDYVMRDGDVITVKFTP